MSGLHTAPALTGGANAVPKWWRDYVADLGPVMTNHIARRVCADLSTKCAADRRVVWEVHRAVRAAVARFTAAHTRDDWLDADTEALFRRLGRKAGLAGRSHDDLHTAYRAAAAVFVRVVLARGETTPEQDIGQLTQGVHDYLGHLADASARGHAEGIALGTSGSALRPSVLSLILGPRPTANQIATMAQRADWTPPETIIVAELDRACLDAGPTLDMPASARALVGDYGGRQVVVFPGDLDRDDIGRALELPGRDALVVVSPRLPLVEGYQAMKINQRLLNHARATRTDGGVMFSEDHVVDLLVEYARAPLAALGAVYLGPLVALSTAKRVRYGRLLSAWLEHGTVRADEPGVLDRKRQTLRYQCERLEQMFGPTLHDRDARVALMLALRAALPTWERELVETDPAAGCAGPDAAAHVGQRIGHPS